jgi:hypothetical protein
LTRSAGADRLWKPAFAKAAGKRKARMGELFHVQLQCSKCGSSGVAMWEQAPDTPELRRLLSLSGGFYQRPLIGTAGAPEIICDRCGTGQRD